MWRVPWHMHNIPPAGGVSGYQASLGSGSGLGLVMTNDLMDAIMGIFGMTHGRMNGWMDGYEWRSLSQGLLLLLALMDTRRRKLLGDLRRRPFFSSSSSSHVVVFFSFFFFLLSTSQRRPFHFVAGWIGKEKKEEADAGVSGSKRESPMASLFCVFFLFFSSSYLVGAVGTRKGRKAGCLFLEMGEKKRKKIGGMCVCRLVHLG